MLRYVMCRRWTDPATCEVFRSLYTLTDATTAEAALLSGGYGNGFDRTECIGVEVDSAAPLAAEGKEKERG